MANAHKIACILSTFALFQAPRAILAQDEPRTQETESADNDDASAEWGEDDVSDSWDSPNKTEVRVHGSFEDQVTGLWLRLYEGGSDIFVNNYTRLRLDVDADLPGGVELRADAVAKMYIGKTSIALINILPKETVDQLVERDARWSIIENDKYKFEDEYDIDNAYLKVPIKDAVVIVGKQPLEQGAGYIWNPTDIFTVTDMFDPTYEKSGIIALRLVLPLASIASIDGMAVPDGDFDDWIGGGRLSLRLGPLSISAAGYYTHVAKTDYEGSMDAIALGSLSGLDPEDLLSSVKASRTMVGGDAVLDVGGVRLWTEGAYNFVEDKEDAPTDWWEITGGIEYFFSFETHVMAEYFHYSQGPRKRDNTYWYNDWMALLSGELKMLGGDFLFESIDHPIGDFWTITASAFQSFSDFSATVMLDVRWEFVQDVELWLLFAGNIGEPEDFLSSSIGQGWLRIKAYF